MTTSQKLIEDAYIDAGIRTAETPLTASEIQDGARALANMLNAWNAVGILKGVTPNTDLSADLLEPDYATWAITATLATILAGMFRIPVTTAMAASATQAKEAMIAAETNLEDIDFPSTLPLGSGNKDRFGDGYDTSFFPENNKRNF